MQRLNLTNEEKGILIPNIKHIPPLSQGLVGIGTGTLCVVGLVVTAWALVYTSKMTIMGEILRSDIPGAIMTRMNCLESYISCEDCEKGLNYFPEAVESKADELKNELLDFCKLQG